MAIPSAHNQQPTTRSPQQDTFEDANNDKSSSTPLGDPPEATIKEGRPKRERKESAYIQRLRSGEGSASGLPHSRTIPRGLQLVEEIVDVAAEMAASVEDEWEMVSVEDWAMATVMEAAEGLNPTGKRQSRPSLPVSRQTAPGPSSSALKTPNVVDCKWVLRVKKNADGEIEKRKARLVARGFTQIYGLDYYETYAPVARLASFRLILALANRNQWPADCIDFLSAYLNAILSDDEVIFLEQPVEYRRKDSRRYVFRLHKSLYGLKQGAKNWYDALRKALEELGFVRTEADHGVFVKRVGEQILILAVHVDDCLVTGSTQKLINKFKVEINRKYKMTDLGPCLHHHSIQF
ncbi:hypothetical protein NLJ89_g12173 [Agrocybe chaxingu]|uniref:Reverse transcriptase Ty1/copia-type domain-containing protein n=1 Tax=Agrocybe chaxingu TaxID=84603 RepID=A0A9W8JVB9_9AGAR|nr:hypothetical protein NLJ89_g12173 [Agrocybe chaxingu]